MAAWITMYDQRGGAIDSVSRAQTESLDDAAV